MKLNQLTKTTTKSKKRLGRGYGSGKGGHTSSRGTKGQKARSKVHAWFEGGQLPLSKRIPFLRGKDRFKSVTQTVTIVNLDQLNQLKPKTNVTKEVLVDSKIISLREANDTKIKILGKGELTQALTFDQEISFSQTAAKKIKQAGDSA